MSLLLCSFIFFSIKVSHRLQYRKRIKKRKKEGKIKKIFVGARKGRKISFQEFSCDAKFKAKNCVIQMVCTCTNAVCPSSVTANAPTKSVDVILIDFYSTEKSKIWNPMKKIPLRKIWLFTWFSVFHSTYYRFLINFSQIWSLLFTKYFMIHSFPPNNQKKSIFI